MTTYEKDIGRCRSCRQRIMWGYRFGKKHPYDVIFDDAGMPHKTSSHFDTCSAASAWRPQSRGIRALGDLNSEQIAQWRASCEGSRNLSSHRLENGCPFGCPGTARVAHRA